MKVEDDKPMDVADAVIGVFLAFHLLSRAVAWMFGIIAVGVVSACIYAGYYLWHHV